jgi:hypothetical protein
MKNKEDADFLLKVPLMRPFSLPCQFWFWTVLTSSNIHFLDRKSLFYRSLYATYM